MALYNFSTSSLSLTNTDASHIHDPYIANFSVFEAVHQFRGDGGSLRCILPRPQLHLAGNLQLAAVILVVPIAFFYFPIPFLLSLSGDTQSEPDGGFDRQTVDGEASDIQTKHRQVSRHLPVIFSDQSDVGSLHVIRIISPITGCWLLITQYSPEKLLSAPSHNFVTRT